MNIRNLIESEYKKVLKESTNTTFLGYHSSDFELEGMNMGEVLDENEYEDMIRHAYMEIISDYDEYLENGDTEGMNSVFEEHGFGFTFVSETPIMGSSFQASEYKYGEFLYEVYGDGNEILLDDVNELQATVVVSKKPLYFKKVVKS